MSSEKSDVLRVHITPLQFLLPSTEYVTYLHEVDDTPLTENCDA